MEQGTAPDVLRKKRRDQGCFQTSERQSPGTGKRVPITVYPYLQRARHDDRVKNETVNPKGDCVVEGNERHQYTRVNAAQHRIEDHENEPINQNFA